MSERHSGHKKNRAVRNIGLAAGGLAAATLDTACTAYLNAQVEQKTITGQTTLAINGVPSNVTAKLNPECTSITLLEGSDKVARISVAPDFRSVTIDPVPGVEGHVKGTGTVGHSGLFGCESDANIPFEGDVDTSPTVCGEDSAQGNAAILQCNGDGTIFNAQTGQQVATIGNGQAVVPLDGTREMDITVRDSAGNQTSGKVAAPSDCAQQQGQIRFDDASQHIQVRVACNGKVDNINVPGGSDYQVGGDNSGWLGLPAGQKAADATVQHQSFQTVTHLTLPDTIPAPQVSVGNGRFENGKWVLEAACKTGLGVGDPCDVQAGPGGTRVKGDGVTRGRIEIQPVGTGPGSVIRTNVVARDTLGNTTQWGEVASSEYTPFQGDAITANKTGKKTVTVSVQHPDGGNNLAGAPRVVATQSRPMEKAPLTRELMTEFDQIMRRSLTSECGLTGHALDVSTYRCELLYDNGPVEVVGVIADKNGNTYNLRTTVNMPDYAAVRQYSYEGGLYFSFVLLVGIAALMITKAVEAEKHHREFVKKQKAVALINTVDPKPKELHALEKPLRRMAGKKDSEAVMLQSLVEQKTLFASIRLQKASRTAATGYQAAYLSSFLDRCTGQNNESLQRMGFDVFVREKEVAAETVLADLSDYISSLENGTAQRLRGADRAAAESTLVRVFRMPDDSWFWTTLLKRYGEEIRTSGPPLRNRKKYASGIGKLSLQRAIIAFYEQHGGIEANRVRLTDALGSANQVSGNGRDDAAFILLCSHQDGKAAAYVRGLKTPQEQAEAIRGFIRARQYDTAAFLLSDIPDTANQAGETVQLLAQTYAETIADEIYEKLPHNRKLNPSLNGREIHAKLAGKDGLQRFEKEIAEEVVRINTRKYIHG